MRPLRTRLLQPFHVVVRPVAPGDGGPVKLIRLWIRIAWVFLLLWVPQGLLVGQTPPAILAQPDGIFILAGGQGTIRVVAKGTQPLKYQWTRDGAPIPEANGASLAITNSNPWYLDGVLGSYGVVVSDSFGAVTSRVAQIRDRVIWRKEDGGNGHGYTVVRQSAPIPWTRAMEEAWSKGGYLACIMDLNENLFVFNAANASRDYWVIADNGPVGPWLGGVQDPAASSPASGWRWITGEAWGFEAWRREPAGSGPEPSAGGERFLGFTGQLRSTPQPDWNNNVDSGWPGIRTFCLEFQDVLAIFRQPESVVVQGDGITNAAFTVRASSLRPICYQWQRDGEDVPSATNNLLVIKSAGSDPDVKYQCVLTDGVTRVVSDPVRVLRPPSIPKFSLANRIVTEGGSVELAVAPEGLPPFQYQWFRNAAPIASATNQTLSLKGLTIDKTAHYWVQVANVHGFANSSSALVKVIPAAFDIAFADDFDTAFARSESSGGFVSPRRIKQGQGVRPFSYLGDNANNKVLVTLTNLPAHTHVHLQVDLLMLRTVDGTDSSGQGDVFQITSAGGELNYRTSFSNMGWSRAQTYPGQLGDTLLNARAGAIEQNTLGATYAVGTGVDRPADALYRVVLDFAHAGPDLELNFAGQGWSPVVDEAWGLDNLVVATANLVEGNPPVLTRVPEPQVVRTGDAAAFHVSAASVGSVSYQWLLDGFAIPGATNRWHAIPAVLPGANLPEVPGNYSVQVSNDYGSVLRPAVPLVVVTAIPESITGVVGKDLTLSGATTRPVSYQWNRDGRVLAGETNATLSLRSPSPADAGRFDLTFYLNGSAVSGGGFEVSGPARVGFAAPGAPGEPLWTHRSPRREVNLVGGYLNPVTPLDTGGFLAEGFALNFEEFTASGAVVSERLRSFSGYSVRGVVVDDQGRRIGLGFTGGSMSSNLLQVYSREDSLLWEARFSGAANNTPAVMANGSIVVGASTYSGAEPTAVHCFNTNGALLWRLPTGRIVGQPSIGVDGIIYFGEENPTNSAQSKVYAVRPDGTVQWSVAHGASVYASPALTIEGDILIADMAGRVTCYRTDGSVRWAYKADAPIRGCSPVVDEDGNIYFATSAASVYSLRPDGVLRWLTQGRLGMSGSLALSQGGSVYAIDGDGELLAFGRDGRLRWSALLPRLNQYWWEGDAPAILSDGTVVAGSLPYFGGGVMQGFRGDGPIASSVWPVGRQDGGMGGRARIRVKPQDGRLSVGGVVEWSAETADAGARFQWFKDGQAIAGADAATFRVGPARPADAGRYQVRMTIAQGNLVGPSFVVSVDEHFERIALPMNGGSTVSWGDLNDDGFSDLLMGRPALWDPATGHWTVPENLLTPANYALVDLEGDGRPEVVGATSARTVEVWKSIGTNKWTLVSSLGFGEQTGQPHLVVPADADADGRMDVLVTTVSTDPAVAARPLPLLLGDGSGGFSRTQWLDVGNGLYGAAWADMDGDQLPELFIARHHSAPPYGYSSMLLGNLGQGQFERLQSVGPSNASTGAWSDYDNDGDLDLFITCANGANNRLMIGSVGAKRLGSAPAGVGSIITDGGDSMGATWGDYDNDGLLDLFVANRIGATCFLYHQNAGGVFSRVEMGSMTSEPGNHHGAAWTDYDNDGWLDLAVARGQESGSVVYHNAGGSNSWLKVRLRGSQSNRLGIGAKVRAEAVVRGTNGWQMRELGGGNGLGQSAPEAHFGLAAAGLVQTLRVEWPSGQVQELTSVAARQVLTVQESSLMIPKAVSSKWGSSVTLAASGEAPVSATYQWFFEGAPIAGASGRSLVLDDVSPASAGSYRLRAVGLSGSVVTAALVLTVDGPKPLAARQVPSAYWPGVPLSVSLRLAPGAGTVAQAIEDQPPLGWRVVSASDGGQWDPVRGRVKFGPYFDDLSRDLVYVVVPSPDFQEHLSFNGTAAADSVTTPVIGGQQVALGPVHPADRAPLDGRLDIGEMTAYASIWRRGGNWSVAPTTIPIEYMTRAGYLWRRGEQYWFDLAETNSPVWWKAGSGPGPGPARQAHLFGVSADVEAIRRLPSNWAYPALLPVVVEVTPGAGASNYAVQEQIPQGWNARATDGVGSVDEVSRWIRWGPFFDSTPRTLRYEITPVSGAKPDFQFNGVFSVDGFNISVGGELGIPLNPSSQPSIRVLPWSPGADIVVEVTSAIGTSMTLEASDDLRAWIPVQSWVGKGDGQPESVTLHVDPIQPSRYWRFR